MNQFYNGQKVLVNSKTRFGQYVGAIVYHEKDESFAYVKHPDGHEFIVGINLITPINDQPKPIIHGKGQGQWED